MTKVKVCGITNLDDALMAVDMGASFLGFIFYQGSRRHIEPEAAAAITRQIPSSVAKAGVFVNQEAEFVNETVKIAGIDIVQLHGDEAPDFCAKVSGICMKAFRVRDETSLERINDYASDFVLLDTFADRQYGGTGRVFDWGLIDGKHLCGKRLFLSGGLSPENVSEGIERVRPYAVDVCSGVERKAGIKDEMKLKSFMREVANAERI